MARLRRRQVTIEGVPAALGDRYSAFWKDPGAVDALAEQYGLSLSYMDGSTRTATPIERFSAFRSAYCFKAGITHPTYPGVLDYARGQAAGIDMASTSRDRVRQAQHR